MDNKIKIIDNCVPITIQDELENLAYVNSNIKYAFTNFASYPKHLNNSNHYQDGSQLVNMFVLNGQFITADVSHFFLLPLQITCLKEKLYFDLQGVIRAKINLKFKQESELDNFTNPPHIDNNIEKALIGIYYINDSDGDTIIYEGRDENNLKISQSIKPKKGRMILMDGSTWHSASHPLKTETRMIINYNFIP